MVNLTYSTYQQNFKLCNTCQERKYSIFACWLLKIIAMQNWCCWCFTHEIKYFEILPQRSEYFEMLSSLGGHYSREAHIYSCLCVYTGGYCRLLCWHKLIAGVNHSPGTLFLPSFHEYLNKYTYKGCFLMLSRGESEVMFTVLSMQLWNFGHFLLHPWCAGMSWINFKRPSKALACFLHEVTGDTGLLGCIHTHASLLTDRWHTSRPICSFTSTIKIHGTIFRCPVCQRRSVFFSVNWIKWAGSQRNCSFQPPDRTVKGTLVLYI